MAVDAVTGTTTTTTTQSTSNSAASQASAKASLDYDSFLQLLIAQMKNQDPTDPMDASEQIAQLATFSQVEQSIQMNSNLETLITGNALTNASSYIGKTITSADEKTSGVVASVRVYSDTMVATTTEGKEIPIVVGVRVGTAPATETTDS
ncbi:flagellar basal-body rod modification protein FlgD [Rhizobium rosettiformans]|uniref:Basal-body rod modification protein FlgD n=2 Tax=Rhizobium rosettiformans TaxID=1368430 RepID=A0A4S8PVI6_9HYPH|nr:flagellar hook assembly protein FlgD [Rhizobium rosettiformans]MBB5277468.1 flagellar basal-body rod modification protein FlgD [Rhizobium rosettiformans]THV33802.1 flagellar hook assembly protein FlgD [Rhizobium rosettiformans W3]